MRPGTKPGWYTRSDMFRTLGFWDGERWTEQTAPSYEGIRASVGTVAGGVVIGMLVVLLITALVGINS